MLDVRPLGLDGVLELRPRRLSDPRGFFSETYSERSLREAGIDATFVQDNHSFSAGPGVLRGLHCQAAPMEQDKLVRVARGRIFDVAVDVRTGSPTFGRWTGLELSADLWNQAFVPKGFAHGFLTLEPDTEVLYKVSAYYSPEHERAIRFDDPDIGIAWPFSADRLMLSDKDRAAPSLADFLRGPA